MAGNPFVGPKAPWINIYQRPWRLDQDGNIVYASIREKCICRCKDPARAAFRIGQRFGEVSVRLDGLDYGKFKHEDTHPLKREKAAYKRIIYLWQLHKAFYNE